MMHSLLCCWSMVGAWAKVLPTKRGSFVIALGICSLTTLVAVEPASPMLTLALEDTAAPPWSFPDTTGLTTEHLALVAKECAVDIHWQVMPWKRCLLMVEEGRVDGLVDISWTAERDRLAVWPRTAAGAVDEQQRLHQATYHLYRRTGEPLNWNGENFLGVQGPIASLPGFSVISLLKAKGVVVDEEARSVESILDKLVLGRVQGAALFSDSADPVLGRREELRTKVERVEPALQTKAYFLVFSHIFAGKYPDLVARLWRSVAKVREDGTWQTHVRAVIEARAAQQDKR